VQQSVPVSKVKTQSELSDDDFVTVVTGKSSHRSAPKQKSPSPSISSESYSESDDSMSDSESKSSTENNDQVGGWSSEFGENCYC